MTVLVAPKALADLKVRDFDMLIGGKWVAAGERALIERVAPSHGVVVSRYQAGSKADAERAIAAARAAFDTGAWPRMTASERSAVLLKAADLIAARAEELAYLDAIEAGKPITQVRGEIAGSVDIWRYAAALARDLHGESYNTLGEGTLGVVLREAIGVVSIITPWNLPFLIVAQKLPFALAAGCTTVVKPSELTSGSTPRMAVAREEVFGPVLSVLTFTTTAEATEIANSVDYGLSAGVWSRDFDTCLIIGRRIRAGTVWMNTFMDGASELPFGGYKQSGLGRELGRHAVEDYTETKTLNMHIGGRTGWWMPQAERLA